MIKNCKKCEFERAEYGVMYCIECWNTGGKEKDEAIRSGCPVCDKPFENGTCVECDKLVANLK